MKVKRRDDYALHRKTGAARPPPTNQVEEEARFRVAVLLRNSGSSQLSRSVFRLTMAGLAWAEILQRIMDGGAG